MSYLTTRQAAEVLDVHHATVVKLVASGDLVPVMKGPGKTGALFFSPGDVRRLARKRAAA